MRYALFLLAGILSAQTYPLVSGEGLQLKNVKAEPATYEGRKAVRIFEPAGSAAAGDGDRLAVITGSEIQDGVIEAELSGNVGAGAVQGARGFVGLAFRVADAMRKFECFYLRPTNARADDQVRRNHSAQYISYPDFPWQRLRKEEPEKYESYVDLQPGVWTKVKIVVKGTTARLYVHGNAQPTLVVNDLKLGVSKGAVALWIGPGTEAHFKNLTIAR